MTAAGLDGIIGVVVALGVLLVPCCCGMGMLMAGIMGCCCGCGGCGVGAGVGFGEGRGDLGFFLLRLAGARFGAVTGAGVAGVNGEVNGAEEEAAFDGRLSGGLGAAGLEGVGLPVVVVAGPFNTVVVPVEGGCVAAGNVLAKVTCLL